MKPSVGLILINDNDSSKLDACLHSVEGVFEEYLIVSAHPEHGLVSKNQDQIFYYQGYLDFTKALNQAFSRATCPWVFIMEDDERLSPESTGFEIPSTITSEVKMCFLPLSVPDNDGDDDELYYLPRLFRRNNERAKYFINEEFIKAESNQIINLPAPMIRLEKESSQNLYRKFGNLLQRISVKTSGSPTQALQLYQGIAWFYLKHFKQALPYFQQVPQSDAALFPQSTVAIRKQIKCLSQLGRNVDAIGLCLAENKHYPNYCDLLYDGAMLFKEKQQYEFAIRWLKKAIDSGYPPIGFHHTIGTDSFLSMYQIGDCYEKIQHYEEAKNYYEQALHVNPRFTPPFCRIFRLILTALGPLKAAKYFEESEKLQIPDSYVIIAEKLFRAGYYKLANEFFQKINPQESKNTKNDFEPQKLIYQIYSGNHEAALKTLELIRSEQLSFELNMEFEEIIALLIHQNYAAAKKNSLRMWSNPKHRDSALAGLIISTYANTGEIRIRPEKSRESAVIQKILFTVERCLNYRPVNYEIDKDCFESLIQLASIGIAVLSCLSNESIKKITEYFSEKEQQTDQLYKSAYFKL